jgi:hypothetical protein
MEISGTISNFDIDGQTRQTEKDMVSSYYNGVMTDEYFARL